MLSLAGTPPKPLPRQGLRNHIRVIMLNFQMVIVPTGNL
jgi:hypothetical protein